MPEGTFDLSGCVERAQRGDAEAAGLLVEHLYPQVIQIVRAHRPRRMADLDLAQEAFVKILTRLDQYRPRAGIPFTHWVSRLTVRTCLDALRAENRRPELRWSDLDEPELRWLDYMASGESSPPEGASSARELVDLLLSRLPPEDRLVLTLLDLEERSVREVSAATGWSVPLVKVRAFRARRRLRRLAEAMGER